jgi:hypothetical protein
MLVVTVGRDDDEEAIAREKKEKIEDCGRVPNWL